MSETKADGYYRQAGSAQAGQPVITRHPWICAVQAAADTILIARLLAGHRLLPEMCQLIANGSQAAMNVDVYVGTTATDLLFNDVAISATTFSKTNGANSAVLEALGVSDEDRDIRILINSGAATAPAGGKLTLQLAQVPSTD